MSPMRHVVRASELLEMMRDAGHALVDRLDEPSHNDTPLDHDDEGGDHDGFDITTPSDHGQSVSNPSGSTPPPQSPDDQMPKLEDVPYVSLDRANQPPPPPP